MEFTTLSTHQAGYSKASSISPSYNLFQIRNNSTAVVVIFHKKFYSLFDRMLFDHLVHIHVQTHTKNDDLLEATDWCWKIVMETPVTIFICTLLQA